MRAQQTQSAALKFVQMFASADLFVQCLAHWARKKNRIEMEMCVRTYRRDEENIQADRSDRWELHQGIIVKLYHLSIRSGWSNEEELFSGLKEQNQ